ncbi:MAG: DinB family protein [Clostridia bacterium]|nr:DinB family protein [Clostridia bacterium]
MNNRNAVWNSKQNLLRSLLLKPDRFEEAIQICLDQHAMAHSSEVSKINEVTFEDELWEDLEEAAFRAKPDEKSTTIAWCLWHITRIEDITMNILVADEPQVYNAGQWRSKLDVAVSDTGNAMSNEEIVELSSRLDMLEFRNYRTAVGRKTREQIQKLQPSDLRMKMKPERLQRILDEGAVLEEGSSRWLIDFWGRKNVAGILLMPITRHLIVHIHEAMALKKKYQSSRIKKAVV